LLLAQNRFALKGMTGNAKYPGNRGQNKAFDSFERAGKSRRSCDRRPDVTRWLRDYAPSLRRQNKAAGKSAAERRSRCGRGGIGRGLGSGAITLR
jgi:hypothetical protein